MLFKKEVTLQSKFDVEKLFDKLEAVIVYDIKHPDKRKFRGKVDRANRSFTIYQPRDIIKREGLKPIITGSIKENIGNSSTCIELNFKYSDLNKMAFVLALIFNTVVYTLMVCLDIDKGFLIFFGIGLPLIFVFGFISNAYYFNLKSKEAIVDLSFILGAREVNN
jgi:hypothetical protein